MMSFPIGCVFLEYETILEPSRSDTAHLTEAGRICYQRLREWRKEKAEKEGIPPFIIAKNTQLAEVVAKEIKTLEALKHVSGFGKNWKNTGKRLQG